MLILFNYLSIILIFLFVAKYDNKMIFFWLAICFLFYLPVTVDYFFAYERRFIVNDVLIFSLIFNSFYLICGYLIKSKSRDGFDFKKVGDITELELNITLIIFFSSIITPVLMVYFKFGGFFISGWRDAKSIPYYLLFLYLYYFSSIALYISWMVMRKKITTFMIILASVVFIMTFQSRSLLLPLLFPMFYHYLYFQGNIGKWKVMLIGSVFLFLFFLLQQFRYVGLSEFDLDTAVQNVISLISEGNGELSIIDVFYYLIESGSNITGYSEGWSYLRMMFFFLPTGWMDIKPNDFSYEIWNAYTGIHGVGGSLHPTHYGMVFGNFGWFGCLLGAILLAAFSRMYDVTVFTFKVNGLLVLSSFLSGSVLMARGSLYNGFMVVILGLMLGIALNIIKKTRFKSR